MTALLFFSGGTALRALSRELARRRYPSIHLITTFDAGGSSRALRDCFAMPAPGDLRNRLLALSATDPQTRQISSFLNQRLDPDPAQAALELTELARNVHNLPLPESAASVIGSHLGSFFSHLPANFHPAIASVGNMALTGAYLAFERDIARAVDFYGSLLRIAGQVIPVSNEFREIAARLTTGKLIIGQHLFKSHDCPIDEIHLTDGNGAPAKAQPVPQALDAIRKAQIICFPMGSFFSSIMATLLVDGVGRAVAESNALKIFIPNIGMDPELEYHDISDQVLALLAILRKDAPSAPTKRLLNWIVVDPEGSRYKENWDKLERNLEKNGMRLCKTPIAGDENHHDPAKLASWLIRLCHTQCT